MMEILSAETAAVRLETMNRGGDDLEAPHRQKINACSIAETESLNSRTRNNATMETLSRETDEAASELLNQSFIELYCLTCTIFPIETIFEETEKWMRERNEMMEIEGVTMDEIVPEKLNLDLNEIHHLLINRAVDILYEVMELLIIVRLLKYETMETVLIWMDEVQNVLSRKTMIVSIIVQVLTLEKVFILHLVLKIVLLM